MNISTLQKQHFLLLDVIPFLGSLVALSVLLHTGIYAIDWIGFILMWLLSVIGIELGYHRYFSHKAFQATTALKSLLVILASMGGQGSVLAWSTNHVHHHRYSDQPQDTHTPMHSGNNGFGKFKGFWHSQVLWKWSYIPPFPTKKVEWLYQDKQIVQLSKWYYLWVTLGLILPAKLRGRKMRSLV